MRKGGDSQVSGEPVMAAGKEGRGKTTPHTSKKLEKNLYRRRKRKGRGTLSNPGDKMKTCRGMQSVATNKTNKKSARTKSLLNLGAEGKTEITWEVKEEKKLEKPTGRGNFC